MGSAFSSTAQIRFTMTALLSDINFRASISVVPKHVLADWIIYYEPRKVTETRGYFAVAKVQQIIPDPGAPGMYVAVIEPGSYLDFINAVPFSGPTGVIETGILNAEGRISGALSRLSAHCPAATSTALSSANSMTPRPAPARGRTHPRPRRA